MNEITQNSQIENVLFVDARAQAQAIGVALRKAARQARAPVSLVSGGGGFSARKGGRAFVIGVYVSLFLFVIVPIVGSGIYYAFVASPQYVSEAHFAVRNGEQSPLDMLGSITGFPQTGRFQDALIVTNYIHSRAMIEQVDAKLNLRRIYSDKHIDYLSRLPGEFSTA
jgi:capsular polysaccharide transport system permease protein